MEEGRRRRSYSRGYCVYIARKPCLTRLQFSLRIAKRWFRGCLEYGGVRLSKPHGDGSRQLARQKISQFLDGSRDDKSHHIFVDLLIHKEDEANC